jgi:hypothetical protein
MKRFAGIKLFLFCIGAMAHSNSDILAQMNTNDTLLRNLMAKQPEKFTAIMKPGNEHRVQVIYTRIDRTKKGKPKFTHHSYGLDAEQYFYPASTVKLPVAILALQKLNELKITGLDRNTTMITGSNGDRQTEVHNDPSAPDGRPSIAHYIKKILLVSDNDAYNRLYEFLGQEYINKALHKMGYTDVQIIHRLEISLTEEENRHTNPVSFFDSKGKLLYHKPAEKSQLIYAARNTRMGKGFMRGGELVNEPFDFSKKNRMGLLSLHNILTSILFPEVVEKEKRFNLTGDDLQFLKKYMSMLPGESKWPSYPAPEYPDAYVKFLYYGGGNDMAEPGLRIFNKPGDAYGFLTDAAYMVDHNNKVEFLLSAVIHCNSDGIYNDNKYDYNNIGFPFMKDLGRLIYEMEKKRTRKHPPDLSPFLINYSEQ